MIPELAKRVRNWFANTHPEIAECFVPFLDFGNGDALGYLRDNTSRSGLELHGFKHEEYKNNAKQDFEEFIVPAGVELTDFFVHSLELISGAPPRRKSNPETGMFED